ncbi:hypothetical protein CONLIGDRAFT_112279 [Coniochaeta ligniaria NRRL 30616]|uniref:C2H2-type domain-containing protein n=1 Tax=Coniochaeta ligniaria NRRL 30616 TaxID=1408157 RepID=A0A1J7I943_9PEZI|nr:hypothetical protein CONLIGDRAFT_112279 [Coniochaeta ligniaria NRRL 30616]
MSEISTLTEATRTRKRRGLFQSPSDGRKRPRLSQTSSPDRRERKVLPLSKRVQPAQTSPTPSPTRRDRRVSPEYVHPDVSTSARSLACPYYKYDPKQHRQCAHANLSKISYVKQHLFRKHPPSIHCSRCYETFGDYEAFEAHQRQRVPCEVKPKRDLPGMTSEQMHKLKTRSNPTQDETGQWEEIWKILFPQTPPPASVYIDLSLPEEVNDLREHMARYIPPRIVNVLGLADNEDLSRELMEMVLDVTDQWIGKRRVSQASTGPSLPPSQENPRAQVQQTYSTICIGRNMDGKTRLCIRARYRLENWV